MRTRFDIPSRSKRRAVVASSLAATALILASSQDVSAQPATRTLVAVLAHADDETPVGPVLARYAREGAKVYLIIASDGGQGTSALARSDSSARVVADLTAVRAEEARRAAQALGAEPPILLGFPDGKLGDFIADRALNFRLSARIAAELERLRPDAIITWGPDGGFGHPDHRIVGAIVTQLVRADAPGATERLFYMYIPPEGFRSMYPQRGEPPLVAPNAKYLTMRVSFTPADLEAANRAMASHRSQLTPETLARVQPMQARYWNGVVPLAPAFSSAGGTDLFR
jgi:LmbE family N-acetylglucosaminyl deacetylase